MLIESCTTLKLSLGGRMMTSCYDWIAFVCMAFSAQDLSYPLVPKVELGEPLIIPSSIGVWSITIAPDFLFCELSMGEGAAIFNCDLSNPTGEQVLRSIDTLIVLAKNYV
jgi:hypothetical protein